MTKKKIVFYSIIWIVIIYMICVGFVTNGEGVIGLFINHITDTFMDFFCSLAYGRHPYEAMVIYPPLINVFYALIGTLLPKELLAQGPMAVRDSQYGGILTGVYFSVSAMLFMYAVLKLGRASAEETLLMCVTLSLSMPFLFHIERANSILLAVIFTMLYLAKYDAEKTWKRHLAFICLSIAAAIKIYPAIFGLLLIRERRWKDALWCILYGVAVFILPILYLGGFGNLPLMFHNILYANEYMSSLGYGWKLGVENTLKVIGAVTGMEGAFFAAGAVCKWLVALLGIVAVLFGGYDSRWKTLMAASLVLVLMPDFSYTYNIMWMAAPLVCFLMEKEGSGGWKDIVPAILFALLFAPVVLPETGWFGMFVADHDAYRGITFYESVLLLVWMVIIYGEGLYGIGMGLIKKNTQTSFEIKDKGRQIG
jgi:hypothetical protein